MYWKHPPRIKIFEAIGAIADGRMELHGINNNEAKVFSSSKRKFYNVKFDGRNAIMSNDNGSYWKDYLGYPSIGFLMMKGIIKYDKKLQDSLKDVKWKEINSEFKNDFKKTEVYCLDLLKARGYEVKDIIQEVEKINEQIKKLNLRHLGPKVRPPLDY